MSSIVRRALAVVLAPCALLFFALSRPLPASLEAPPEAGTVVLDRSGQRLRALRSSAGELGGAASLAELSPWVVPALLAAEDSRFRAHPGVDPLSVLRAFGQLCRERRIVSGASTLTMQLARLLEPHPRDLGGKLTEMRLALRLEVSLSKDQILEEYLGRIDLAPGVRGIEAASRELLDRPASALELADAALLAGLARAPSALDPRRHPERAKARRDVVLARMLEQGRASRDEVERALATPVSAHRPRAEGGTLHVAVGLGRGRLLGSVEGAT
ncbi:MAG: transglycosylase domain-containing protein, partial [Deltaproteobacteria bacterium]|nr:transglycosylase domain-containing protein [Deltaproteobacteria bacterium]